ncbi:MAG: adenosylcobalamin-dependent ribonucleoside-diphosphate reductase [Fibrobacteria bacterium]|nr:adenosylcobalamin-dependent ribonucleoside-diphosphate reductase [Fibrobacteria bacterium]
MKISRRYTKKGNNPFSSVEYEWRSSTIRNEDGSSHSQTIQLEVPKQWSQLATDILAQKYIRRSNVPQVDENGSPKLDKEGNREYGSETSIKQIVDRLAACWKLWGEQYNYFDTKEDADTFYDEMIYMLLHQIGAPNSPQWFNTGLAHKYDIKGTKQGHWYVDPSDKQLKEGEDAFTHPQPHACFIQSVEDDLLGDNGIYSLLTREGRIFKFGSGTGTNFSNIRGVGEPLGSGGISSGLMSFLRIYNRAAGSIKSGGTTRRAAKMVCLDIDHPEIEEFITWKSKEEQKVAALVTGTVKMKKHLKEILDILKQEKDAIDNEEGVLSPKLIKAVRDALDAGLPDAIIQRAMQLGSQGIDDAEVEELTTDFEGGAYATVSGQNSNNSIRLSHKFMSQVQKDGDWDLIGRVSGKSVKSVPAKKLWDKICRAAWECADPGLQFDDTINDWHTCPSDGRIRSSNPCSEYMFLDDTACNLASLNLGKFIDDAGDFQIEDFEHSAKIWTMVLEISVTMAQFPSKEIAKKSYDYRTLGIGYANLGSILMRLGIPYDSNEAEALTGAITAILTGVAYSTSAELAKEHGPFERFEYNKKQMLKVIRNHRRAAYNAPISEYEKLDILPVGLQEEACPSELLSAARRVWDTALTLGEKYGYRNAQVSVIAPTGTIGLLMDCDTTGIEPDFALIKFKKLSGGGYFKIVNQSVAPALERLGYTPQQIIDIEAYCKGKGSFKGAPNINVDSLTERGFSTDTISQLSKALRGAFHLRQAFNERTLGNEMLQKLNISKDDFLKPGFDILIQIGFSEKEIEAANYYICGTQTIENAPHLLKEHYPVFDCANICGPLGTRFISSKGHLRLIAAAQPFISGSISKTINIPENATVQQTNDIFKLSWELGLKAVTIYRDNSKLSQPLQAASTIHEVIQKAKALKALPPELEVKVKTEKAFQPEWPQTMRRKLPSRRGGFVQEATVGGHKLFLRTGEYPDGSLGEIFIDMYKEGASYRGLLNCFAVLASKALQYGVPLKELVESFTFTRFDPAGPVTGHEHIKSSTSILDFVFRTVGHHYLNLQEFLHVKPAIEDVPDNSTKKDVKPKEANQVKEEVQEKVTVGANKAFVESRQAGYTGDACSSCGSLRVRQNGTCTVCDDCGTTSGCS